MGRPGTFQPGQSGNPSGRPKAAVALAQECQKYAPEVITLMAQILRGQSVKRQVLRNGKKVTIIDTPTFADRQDSAKWFADRGFGKAATVLAGEGGVGPSEIVIRLSSPLPEIKKD